jgi:hypothetical protein
MNPLLQAVTLLRKAPALVAAGALCVLANQASATVITKTNSTAGLFDASSGLRAFTFTIGESGDVINDVDISIDFGKHDGENFGINAGGTPFYNEIVFTLTNGTDTARLIDAGSWSSGSGGFLSRVITFDESASQVVNFTSAPQAGTFQTTGFGSGFGLDQFNGQVLQPGVWNLFIQDTTGADALDFHSATLKVTVTDVPDTTATFGLMLVGLSAMALARRKLQR